MCYSTTIGEAPGRLGRQARQGASGPNDTDNKQY